MTAESSVLLGSVSYLSPEQVQRGVADSRSDVYALGIVAFELLTGEKPFAGETPIQIAYKHVNEKVPAPSSLVAGIPPALDELVLSATSVNPDERPRDAEEFLTRLRDIQTLLDPQRPQLSLELDLPPAPIREKSRSAKRVAALEVNSPTERVEPMAPKASKRENTEQVARTKRAQTSARVRRNRKVAGFFAIVAAAGLWFAFSGVGARVVVPSIVGGNVTQAAAALSPLGLKTEVSERVFNEDIPAGIIITSKPAGGAHVKPGATVSFVVSKGPERYNVPSLVKLTADAALALLKSNSLVAGNVTEVFNPKIAQGLIISTSPAANTSVTRDTPVDMVISKGPDMVAYVSYVGKSAEQALNELTDAGFVVNPDYVYSDTVATGAVISQTPDGPASAPKGTKISLSVSKGSALVYIPNVYSLTEAAATGLLQDLDLVVTVKKIGTHAVKNVTNVLPKVGTQVKRGSTVIITVG
jgi:serine/threonine-protein kinase